MATFCNLGALPGTKTLSFLLTPFRRLATVNVLAGATLAEPVVNSSLDSGPHSPLMFWAMA